MQFLQVIPQDLRDKARGCYFDPIKKAPPPFADHFLEEELGEHTPNPIGDADEDYVKSPVLHLSTLTPAFSLSHVFGVMPACLSRYFCTRSVGVLGRLSMNSTKRGTAKWGILSSA